MENRGRKRAEMVEQLPADKRACSLSEYQPGSSSSSPQTPPASINPVSEAADCDMESSSSASVSGRSEGEVEKDSAYGSCDSDGMEDTDHRRSIYREFQRRNSKENEVKLKKILPNLDAEAGPCAQLAALTELCDILSLCMDDYPLANLPLPSFIPNLVRLAKHESSPDIMLLAIRALSYLYDVFPRSSGFLVRYNAVPALCERLMVIEYLDVAEQSLQALEKISRDHPVTCLKAGAIMAVLSYIDFFSTSIQRVAVSIVANVCKKLPSDCSALVMEAVPILCNLLHYEDRKLVEAVALCLIRMVECLSCSSETLDELCKHRLIQQSTQLIALDSQMTLNQLTYTGLIGMLGRLASRSLVAVRTLFELNISRTMRGILSSSDLSHGTTDSHLSEMHSNQVHEVLKLLNELLPPLARDGENIELVSAKENILADQPELLRQFGMDILPILIEVVSSGANLYVYYGCLSVINKLVYFSTADILLDLFKNTNISSFLAGVFSQKDHHLLISALKTAEIVMQKLPDVFLNSFVKEGVVYAVNALAMPQKCSESLVQHLATSNYKISGKDVQRCLCYAFDISRPPLSSEAGSCKLEKDTVHVLAKHIKATYFTGESWNSEIGLTEVINKLRTFCAVLTDNVDMVRNKDYCAHGEEYLSHIVDQIMAELYGGNPMSTFEFIESGIVKSLAHYLSGGKYLKGEVDCFFLSNHCHVVLRRFEMFARASLSSLGQRWEDMPLTPLLRKLQSALSSLGNFPVILSQAPRTREAYASIPSGHYTKDPCLRVRFVKEEGETNLCDYSTDVLTVEAFSSFRAIEGFLWPKVSTASVERHEESTGKDTTQMIDDLDRDLLKAKDAQFMKLCRSSGLSDKQGSMEKDASAKTNDLMNAHSLNSPCDDAPKLLFFLEGKQLEHSLTLYQAILLQMNEEPDVSVGPRFWYEVYEVKYRRALEQKGSDFQVSEFSSACNGLGISWKKLPFFSTMLAAELPCNLEKSNPAYDILFLLKVLEGLNRFSFHLLSHERSDAFAKGRIDSLDDLKVTIPVVPQIEFLSSKLTEKLEQQMRDPLARAVGGMPSWCSQLMAACPFLFAFEARRKYFRLTTFTSSRVQPHPHWTNNNSNATTDRRSHAGSLEREKFQVFRSHILDSAMQMMHLHARSSAILEVEYNEEVGTGLGPTMEFYTLVSHEFQKVGLDMWREDHSSSTDQLHSVKQSEVEGSEFVVAPLGLFPRPWSSTSGSSNGTRYDEVIQKFVLLGQVIAKALQDGRVLDLPFSKAFYKIILGQDLDIYDIQSFDPELGRTLLEFQALAERRRNLGTISGEDTAFLSEFCFRNTRIEDLCLDFTLPGYSDYKLASGPDHMMVNINNLEEYISLTVDATVRNGISRQVEAFKSGFNQVFPLKTIQIFTEDEVERLLCGEHDTWASGDLLEHIKFDHGYTATSPPIVNLLEIIQDFGCDQRRAFLQFVTGAPRLPPGGLASLNPKLTIVRKQWSKWEDADLPSVMTCANYLKLPPYSSKERMRERLLYAITEGQGSFHLS
ncbi:E3 ubiquitin-protein ligase UPL4 [Magnolia sinica]|uniref:E3 ubiquitin-protein ligase UPL4 n=1 Tax=Magnolia sinica TaxID=86752 RepID=UPI002659EAF2|nr:E3 ubiquitin-protein ligase UPL4 [Magnolia sinica]XP_058110159.1 E3 ubiquitin-protein ligase UPL4 [Magnolia sinica]XP_058110160.1 E3 ubiquitin-protein ligase UPL4 [Magnolia sinica]